MNKQPILYKRDTNKRIRIWSMEIDGDRYRTVSGLQDGQLVTTEWTVAVPKNVGRANATSGEQQALSELESQYTKKLECDYHRSIDDIDTVRFFKPMLAQSWDKRKDRIDYGEQRVFFQPKLDGIRCIVNREGAFSRTGKRIVAIPHVVDMLQPVFDQYPDAVFDGELYNHDLKHDFNEIVSMVRKTKVKPEDLQKSASMVQYHVYDYPAMLNDTFDKRFLHLTNLLDQYHVGNTIHIVNTSNVTSEREVDTLYGQCLAQGYEGGIVRLNDVYHQKRCNSLIKRKDFEDAEFEIIRVEEGNGNWSGVAKRVFFRNDTDGREVGAGLKGSREYAAQVLQDADQYVGKQVTVQFFTRTPDGVPRFPIAKVLHKDKRW